MKANKNIIIVDDPLYGESPLVKAAPAIANALEVEKCRKNFHYWLENHVLGAERFQTLKKLQDPESFRKQYMQDPVPKKQIDEVLPDNEYEKIPVVAYGRHFDFFVRLVSDYVKKDLRRNYRIVHSYHELRGGVHKLIILNGGRSLPDSMLFEIEEMANGRGIKVLKVWDRELENELKK